MPRTIEFKFNEQKHELRAGNKTNGRPYFIVSKNLPASDNGYFDTLEELRKFVIVMPDNHTHVKGRLTVAVNGEHMLYAGSTEGLQAARITEVYVAPVIQPHNHLTVTIDCEEVSSNEPYIVQLQLL